MLILTTCSIIIIRNNYIKYHTLIDRYEDNDKFIVLRYTNFCPRRIINQVLHRISSLLFPGAATIARGEVVVQWKNELAITRIRYPVNKCFIIPNSTVIPWTDTSEPDHRVFVVVKGFGILFQQRKNSENFQYTLCTVFPPMN